MRDRVHFIVDREAYEGATALIESFGERALAEASIRAEHSRERGNHIHYAHWCRIGRTIMVLGDPGRDSSVH